MNSEKKVQMKVWEDQDGTKFNFGYACGMDFIGYEERRLNMEFTSHAKDKMIFDWMAGWMSNEPPQEL